jgi:nicotinate-nucleotide adenylyltransferase
MVSLATAMNPAFVPSDVELRRDGPSYTVETVRQVAQELPGASLVLIVGADTYPEMSTWRDSPEILARCAVAIAPRPGEPDGQTPEERAGVTWLPGAGLAISATAIRACIEGGRSIRYLVPDAVADYIAKKGLYR